MDYLIEGLRASPKLQLLRLLRPNPSLQTSWVRAILQEMSENETECIDMHQTGFELKEDKIRV